MSTLLDKHISGHYSVSFPAGTLTTGGRAITAVSHATISGESLALNFANFNQTIGVTKGVTHDEFIIHGLYITNTSDQSFNTQLYFDYASTYANNAIVPPLSTIYVITADNPITWNGSSFQAKLNGRGGSIIGGGAVAIHMVWSAVVKT